MGYFIRLVDWQISFTSLGAKRHERDEDLTHSCTYIEDDVGVYQSTGLLLYRFLILATRGSSGT